MARAMVEEHIALAELHVTQWMQRWDRQAELILELERDGHDTTEAKAVLTVLEETLKARIADCDRLWGELASSRPR